VKRKKRRKQLNKRRRNKARRLKNKERKCLKIVKSLCQRKDQKRSKFLDLIQIRFQKRLIIVNKLSRLPKWKYRTKSNKNTNRNSRVVFKRWMNLVIVRSMLIRSKRKSWSRERSWLKSENILLLKSILSMCKILSKCLMLRRHLKYEIHLKSLKLLKMRLKRLTQYENLKTGKTCKTQKKENLRNLILRPLLVNLLKDQKNQCLIYYEMNT